MPRSARMSGPSRAPAAASPRTATTAPRGASGWVLLVASCGLQWGAVMLMKGASVHVGGGFLQKATSVYFVAALVAMGTQFFVWRKVLEKLPISIAYPVSAIVVPANLLGSATLFGEHLSRSEMGAGLVVTLGVAILTHAQATAPPAVTSAEPTAPEDPTP